MRNILLKLSLLMVVASPFGARAASMDQLVVSGAVFTATFILPSNLDPAGDQIDPMSGFFSGVEVTGVQATYVVGSSITVSTDTLFFGTSTTDIALDDQMGPTLNGFSLFNQSEPDPELVIGSGTLYLESDNDLPFTYTISAYAEPTAATPEPSSLILIGTGALGVASVLRRRLFGEENVPDPPEKSTFR
jgi:hypothetical protein